jgi:hypothetical protein
VSETEEWADGYAHGWADARAAAKPIFDERNELRARLAALTPAPVSPVAEGKAWCYCPSIESEDLASRVCSKCGNPIKPVGGGV